MKLGSIRWRLVASYVGLTLLTVVLVGILANSLILRFVAHQERTQLEENARGVAQQALPLMWPTINRPALRELASTTAFLGEMQISILDKDQRLIVDSGTQAEADEFVWIRPPDGFGEGLILARPAHTLLEREAEFQNYRLIYPLNLPRGTRVTVVQRQASLWGNRFVFEMRSEGTGPIALRTPVDETPLSHPPPIESAGSAPGMDLITSVPIGHSDNPYGYVKLTRRSSFTPEVSTLLQQGFLLAGVGGTVIAILVGLFVSKGLTAPLAQLNAVVRQMSGGDLSIRAVIQVEDEIGQLAAGFNEMADRLEANFELISRERDTLRRFITDASHEFRTPITALKNFNQLLQGDAAEEPNTRHEFLAESQKQIERLEWITQNLLDLSRLDAGLVVLELGVHDAVEILDSALDPFRSLAVERGIKLHRTSPDTSELFQCDRSRIELALGNLIDNALKFSTSGGSIEARVNRTQDRIRFTVLDTGIGIELDDQPFIFQRFYRGKGSPGSGSGLGLAIVESVVNLHHGQVGFDSQTTQGSLFYIELPLQQSY